MIYIHECRVCGLSSLAPDSLKLFKVCGNCFVDPRTDLIFLDSDRKGKDRNPC